MLILIIAFPLSLNYSARWNDWPLNSKFDRQECWRALITLFTSLKIGIRQLFRPNTVIELLLGFHLLNILFSSRFLVIPLVSYQLWYVSNVFSVLYNCVHMHYNCWYFQTEGIYQEMRNWSLLKISRNSYLSLSRAFWKLLTWVRVSRPCSFRFRNTNPLDNVKIIQIIIIIPG